MTVQEKREMTLEEQIEAKKKFIEVHQNLVDWGDASMKKEVDKLTKKLRSLEAQLPVNQKSEEEK
ncbi:hypothetical protein [Bacillus cereus group sp. BfR-BA-01355]|uniref:hypothetical protein n=1 Tax=Bacillus cereus group sp. BfR-BA-01355 TaxID=2920318 RepID=UPI001F58EC8B|nr:hypothetical protein [Bacillus cereus group sp. BfR-BA-01355]